MELRVGDKVVYPGQGVSVVEEVVSQEFLGRPVMCYRLRILATNSTVLVPVDNCERVGLRDVAPPSEVLRLLEVLRLAAGEERRDWKDRFKQNSELIKRGELEDVVQVLLSLTAVASRKQLSFREKRMFEQAKQLFSWEAAESLGRTVEDVERELEGLLDDLMASGG